MEIEYINVEAIDENTVIAEDIYTKDGVLVVPKNTLMTESILRQLKYFKIQKISTYKNNDIDEGTGGYEAHIEGFKEDYNSNVVLVKKVILDLYKGEKLDVDAIRAISISLFDEISYGNSAVRYISRMKEFDEYTYHHCVNVGTYATLMGKWLNYSAERTKELSMAGVLHDIGKYRVPIEVLNKKGKLTKEEFEIIKKHSIYGYEIVKEDESLNPYIKDAVLCHHERENGSGYPFGLESNRISENAKIIAVADFYDALTSKRPYRDKLSPFETIKIFQQGGMEEYDLSVSLTFFKNIVNCYIGEKAMLSDGRIGTIMYIPPHDLTSPVIKVENELIDLSKREDIIVEKLI